MTAPASKWQNEACGQPWGRLCTLSSLQQINCACHPIVRHRQCAGAGEGVEDYFIAIKAAQRRNASKKKPRLLKD